MALSGSVSLRATAVALLAGLGLLIGAAIALSHWLVDRAQLRGVRSAAVLAAPSILWAIPLGITLFQGSLASTLPGASWGHVWVPALVYALSTVAILVAERLASGRRGRWLLTAALALTVVLIELANRTFFPSLYPQLHALLVVLSAAVAGLVLAALPLTIWPWLEQVPRLVLAGAVAVATLVALLTGLQSPSDRWTVSTEGTHLRHLSRIIRDAMDRDGDGFSPILGGGDCDDGDPATNPAAIEVAGNGRDEDCDGFDAAMASQRQQPVRPRAEQLAEFLASAPARALLERGAQQSVLVLSIDALRADMLTDTAQNRRDFPHLMGFMDEAVAFDHAFSPAAGTDIALSSFVTGRVSPFGPIESTLIESMAESGRTTFAALPREVLRYVPKTLLTRGLTEQQTVVADRVQKDVADHVTAAETTSRGLRFLTRSADKPFFAWLHYFDVHEHLQLPIAPALLAEVESPGQSAVEQRYRALCRVVDKEIGRLLGELERRGTAEETIVVLMSDHGESLGDDPRLPRNHGLYVYNGLTHVPLAVRVPGVAPHHAREPVSLYDLAPTLLALVGAPPLAEVDGISLVPHFVPGAPTELVDEVRGPLVQNESEQWAVLEWPYKLLVRPRDNLVELYDLSSDWDEQQNLAAALPAVVSRLKQAYAAFPAVHLDRTREGRRWREQQARKPARR